MEFAMARPIEPETYTERKSCGATGSISEPQARNRVVVNAREQPPVAPLFVIETGAESPAQNGALDLQSGERACKRTRLDAFWFLLSRAHPLASGALNLVVPQEGFEPPTPSLRMMCSTD
jgi:hypothetical protein